MAMDSNYRSPTSGPQPLESLTPAILTNSDAEEPLVSEFPADANLGNPSLMIDGVAIPPARGSSSQVLSSPPNQRQLAWQVAPNVLLSFRYAGMGVVYAFSTQRNLRIHTIIGAIALGLSVFLQLPLLEIAVIGLTIALVLAMELLNTAIESVVDLLVKQTYHDLAKIAKDCAAGAVLIAAMASVLVAGLLLLPPLYQKLMVIF